MSTLNFSFDVFSCSAIRLRDRVTLDTLRPLNLFLGLTGPSWCLSPGAFAPPTRHVDKTMFEKIRARVRLNFAFFLSNYALVAFGVAVVIAMSHPGMLLFVGAVWLLWMAHAFLIDHELIIFGTNVGMLLSITQRSTLLSVLTIIVVIWKCLVPLIVFVTISGIIILSHALMRDPKHIENSTEFREDSDDEVIVEQDKHGVMVERGDVI
mmetsp:Transcript_18520/g.33555  ORF Transcript_18520/g.33555 Transcript_18520/m.33555 type:complete len:209 (-) Transcript_18520:609-1235(-)